MHKYEFYGTWNNCDSYWDNSIDNENAEITTGNPTDKPTENSNEQYVNVEIKVIQEKKNIYKSNIKNEIIKFKKISKKKK
jgi:hypothetical protein